VVERGFFHRVVGFDVLAAVQDVFSRRIVGWSMCDDLKAELVLDALGMAVSARGPNARALELEVRAGLDEARAG